MIECEQSQIEVVFFFLKRADNSDNSVQIRLIIELFHDLTVTYILTKFGNDWLFFVDAKEYTKSN